MTLWAIVYTLNGKGKPRSEPYIFTDTVSMTRMDAWKRWSEGWQPESVRRMRRRWGAKAIKVKVEVVP